MRGVGITISDAQLKELAEKVGPERILVVHLKGLGGEETGVRKEFVEGMDHVLLIEMRERFGRWFEEVVERTEKVGREQTMVAVESMGGCSKDGVDCIILDLIDRSFTMYSADLCLLVVPAFSPVLIKVLTIVLADRHRWD